MTFRESFLVPFYQRPWTENLYMMVLLCRIISQIYDEIINKRDFFQVVNLKHVLRLQIFCIISCIVLELKLPEPRTLKVLSKDRNLSIQLFWTILAVTYILKVWWALFDPMLAYLLAYVEVLFTSSCVSNNRMSQYVINVISWVDKIIRLCFDPYIDIYL